MTQDRQLCRWHAQADAAAVDCAVAARILAAATAATAARGAFHLVLAGGTTPRRIYEALRVSAARWECWHIYFGDERCLPPQHPERNSRMAAAAWLDHVAIPPRQVHPMPADLGATAAAAAYARTLAGVAEFDLVLLGLGEDGHTASLFPGHDWGEGDAAADVLAVFDAPKPPSQRVSLSARRLGMARQVIFLAAGTAKREALAAWRNGEAIPAAAVRPAAGVDIYYA